MKTLLLTEADVKKLITFAEAIKIVEKVFYFKSKNLVVMPPKIYLDLPEYNGDFRAMPAYVKPLDACGIKWVCSYPYNKKYKLPSVMAVIILNNPKNAFPLAIVEATYITNLRTGAAGAVAVKHIVKSDVKTISFVGCGVQAYFQFHSIKEVKKFSIVKLYDIDYKKMLSFAKEIKNYGYDVVVCSSVKDCVKDADIICTTTPSRKPLVKLAWIKNNVHINAIGADAPGKQELDIEILKKAKIIVDDYKQAMHSGEINVAIKKGVITQKEIFAELGELVAKNKKVSSCQITIFDSTGLGIQDIAVARYVYKKAKMLNIGNKINFL
ncbi:MAG: ornithine cyclodeaminase family protein [Endomicrobia bacterium]|nr:ornithine cyclodeaminase family protein [Endomicrobiia bacterium]MDW8056522.1 ornithine cyclodeaminase family protein [Elusimicrobiota bacterium]